MSGERLFSPRNRWFTTAVGLTVLITLVSIVTGFVWLPSVQANARFRGVWDAICSAAGLVYRKSSTDVEVNPRFQTSSVVVLPGMLRAPSAVSIGRGATLALQCTICHGARGVSNADTPNLAGQYPFAIYKQLQDYKSGARTSAIMGSRVSDLSEQDMEDLAAYYAYLPRLVGFHPATAGPMPQIVVNGSPMRNIPPCAACHGTIDYKTGSAWLEGESQVYLRAQLTAFKSGVRHNDISEQMRNVARNMTAAEIEQASSFYANQPK